MSSSSASELCQINEVQTKTSAKIAHRGASELCQINEVQTLFKDTEFSKAASELCQINEVQTNANSFASLSISFRTMSN